MKARETDCVDCSRSPSGLSDWPGWVAWYVAEQRGFFKEHGAKVKLVWFGNDTDSVAALSAGQLDANADARDFSAFGGWRAYLAGKNGNQAKEPAMSAQALVFHPPRARARAPVRGPARAGRRYPGPVLHSGRQRDLL